MANSILASVFSKPSLRVVNERASVDGIQTVVWRNFKTLSVEIDAASANASIPISTARGDEALTGQLVMQKDVQTSKIIRPSRMRITGFAPDISTVTSILSSFADLETTLTITSKSIIAEGMVIERVSIEQDPEAISAQKVTIELEQAIPPEPATFDPLNPADESEYGVRVQRPPTAAASVRDLYNKVSTITGRIFS